MSRTGCDMRRLVDAHFEGGLDPAGERRLRVHLPDCADCRARYEQHLALAALDPRATSAEDRLARGLGFRRPRRRWQMLAAPVLFAATAAVLLLLLPVWMGPDDDGFSGRGGGDATASLRVYRIAGDQGAAQGAPHAAPHAVPLRSGDTIAPDDELAFAYENPSGRTYLLVFAVDDHGGVYWYHPAWERGQAAPRAVSIEAGPAVRELPAAIRHDIRGERLWVRAIFGDRPLGVEAVEALVAALPDPGAPLPLPDADQRTIPLKVARRKGGAL